MGRGRILFLFLALQCCAAIRYVDKAASGANNGTSWTDAWTNIMYLHRDSNNIVAGDTVWIKAGDYTETHGATLRFQEGSAGNWTRYYATNGIVKTYSLVMTRNYTEINGWTIPNYETNINNNTYLVTLVTNNCNFLVDRSTNWYDNPSGGYGIWQQSDPTILKGIHIIGFTNRYDGDPGGKSGSCTTFFYDGDPTDGTITNELAYCWSEHSSGNGAGALISCKSSTANIGLRAHHNFFDTVGSDGVTVAPGLRFDHNIIGEREGHPDMGCNDSFFGGPTERVYIDHNIIIPGDNDLFSFWYGDAVKSNLFFYCNVIRPPLVGVQTSRGNAGFEQAVDSPTTNWVHIRTNVWFANNTLVAPSYDYPAAMINLKTRDNPGSYGFAIDAFAWNIVNNLIVRTSLTNAPATLAPFALASWDSSLDAQTNSLGYGWDYDNNGIILDYNLFVDYNGNNLRIGTWGSYDGTRYTLTNAANVTAITGYSHNQNLTNSSFLADPASFNYQPKSSLVIMGTNLTSLTNVIPDINLDITGIRRPLSGFWSAGALEYTDLTNALVLNYNFSSSDGWPSNHIITDKSPYATNHALYMPSTNHQTWPSLTNGPGSLSAAQFVLNWTNGSGYHIGTYTATTNVFGPLASFTNGTWALWANLDGTEHTGSEEDDLFLSAGQNLDNWNFGCYYDRGPSFYRTMSSSGQEPFETYAKWPTLTNGSGWHHYAITWDGTNWTPYLDGSLYTSSTSWTNSNSKYFTNKWSGPMGWNTDFGVSEIPLVHAYPWDWIGGGTVGLDWADCASANGIGYGNMTSENPPGNPVNDATEILSGPWGATQSCGGIVYFDRSGTLDAQYIEVELRLRSSISAHSNSGYEIVWSGNTSAKRQGYIYVVRWNGPFGDNTAIGAGVQGNQYCLNTGDTISATITNTAANTAVIKAYINGTLQYTGTDTSSINTGNPGIGFDISGDLSQRSKYGFDSFWAQDDKQGILISTNSAGVSYSYIAMGVNSHSGTPAADDADLLPNNGQLYGQLADVRIYKRALTAQEIQAIYQLSGQTGGGGGSTNQTIARLEAAGRVKLTGRSNF